MKKKESYLKRSIGVALTFWNRNHAKGHVPNLEIKKLMFHGKSVLLPASVTHARVAKQSLSKRFHNWWGWQFFLGFQRKSMLGRKPLLPQLSVKLQKTLPVFEGHPSTNKRKFWPRTQDEISLPNSVTWFWGEIGDRGLPQCCFFPYCPLILIWPDFKSLRPWNAFQHKQCLSSP